VIIRDGTATYDNPAEYGGTTRITCRVKPFEWYGSAKTSAGEYAELASRHATSERSIVIAIQANLRTVFFDIVVDGKLGPQTRKGIRAFQAMYGYP